MISPLIHGTPRLGPEDRVEPRGGRAAHRHPDVLRVRQPVEGEHTGGRAGVPTLAHRRDILHVDEIAKPDPRGDALVVPFVVRELENLLERDRLHFQIRGPAPRDGDLKVVPELDRRLLRDAKLRDGHARCRESLQHGAPSVDRQIGRAAVSSGRCRAGHQALTSRVYDFPPHSVATPASRSRAASRRRRDVCTAPNGYHTTSRAGAPCER